MLKSEPKLEAKKAAFKYQMDAVTAVRDLEYSAIFHEQGLGKTKIAIDLLLYWLAKKDIDTVLIVTKKLYGSSQARLAKKNSSYSVVWPACLKFAQARRKRVSFTFLARS